MKPFFLPQTTSRCTPKQREDETGWSMKAHERTGDRNGQRINKAVAERRNRHRPRKYSDVNLVNNSYEECERRNCESTLKLLRSSATLYSISLRANMINGDSSCSKVDPQTPLSIYILALIFEKQGFCKCGLCVTCHLQPSYCYESEGERRGY